MREICGDAAHSPDVVNSDNNDNGDAASSPEAIVVTAATGTVTKDEGCLLSGTNPPPNETCDVVAADCQLSTIGDLDWPELGLESATESEPFIPDWLMLGVEGTEGTEGTEVAPNGEAPRVDTEPTTLLGSAQTKSVMNRLCFPKQLRRARQNRMKNAATHDASADGDSAQGPFEHVFRGDRKQDSQAGAGTQGGMGLMTSPAAAKSRAGADALTQGQLCFCFLQALGRQIHFQTQARPREKRRTAAAVAV
ncbi:uncharacterized protein ColSpa_12200 [Colletotrichum spaethianum]|uniref:Uncharacterized protein n=1 Tax=Colletotrichum spaethianum TaxID=700344 RepID=A0AA37UKZ6_9PEZI|nr:uncharacterized protein ColSpa_12200 [Colletotrichum spaethianum]GKT52019.1 hypothetical protein ColSpa_12200 [Colletotrichum spaethianum]